MSSKIKLFNWSSNPQENTRQCRICFQSQEEDQDNPLINPACACKGNLTYIHEDCLIREIQSRYFGFLFFHYNCSICKKLIQFKICQVKKPFLPYFIRLILYLIGLILLGGGVYWLMKNNKRYGRKFFGYPDIKIYDYIMFASMVAMFLFTWLFLIYVFTERKTEQRRIQFQEK